MNYGLNKFYTEYFNHWCYLFRFEIAYDSCKLYFGNVIRLWQLFYDSSKLYFGNVIGLSFLSHIKIKCLRRTWIVSGKILSSFFPQRTYISSLFSHSSPPSLSFKSSHFIFEGLGFHYVTGENIVSFESVVIDFSYMKITLDPAYVKLDRLVKRQKL